MQRLPEHVHHGVFLISSGKDSFFGTAYAGRRFRYDPGCMLPCDARARQTAQFFTDVEKYADEHVWSEPGQVLLIDNRRVLHARASAVQEPQREVQRISYHLKREAS
ncbi:TauD/TfdA family dioxygenase [Streptomyces sp. NPDC007905]|uniref:TauD/TfdA family dioxygenase n=1 Tax=Streptomyces sp. NPDC007905 TaxID=3364788 RepID=UPI0036E95427